MPESATGGSGIGTGSENDQLQQLMEFIKRDSAKRDEQHQEIVSGMSTLTNALSEVCRKRLLTGSSMYSEMHT